ncbi:hypothetical protein AB6A40_008050 [Gnathostoma spinigerum]|uniref:Histone deacetylase complex subunit SAP30 zinc-finger domain-containing protein n=1 Tax=Gnathostoma spinigerum TaxID=75299 RepID=A0ABD6EV51_9BILA
MCDTLPCQSSANHSSTNKSDVADVVRPPNRYSFNNTLSNKTIGYSYQDCDMGRHEDLQEDIYESVDNIDQRACSSDESDDSAVSLGARSMSWLRDSNVWETELCCLVTKDEKGQYFECRRHACGIHLSEKLRRIAMRRNLQIYYNKNRPHWYICLYHRRFIMYEKSAKLGDTLVEHSAEDLMNNPDMTDEEIAERKSDPMVMVPKWPGIFEDCFTRVGSSRKRDFVRNQPCHSSIYRSYVNGQNQRFRNLEKEEKQSPSTSSSCLNFATTERPKPSNSDSVDDDEAVASHDGDNDLHQVSWLN